MLIVSKIGLHLQSNEYILYYPLKTSATSFKTRKTMDRIQVK